MEERIISFFRFEDLRVYNKAIEYGRWVVSALAAPRSEAEKTLQQSFVRSSSDIAINIAEGSSNTKDQFGHFLKISKSAIRECVVYTEMSYQLGLLDEEQRESSREVLMELTRMIGALIVSLSRGPRRRQDNLNDEFGLDMEVNTDIATDFPELES